MPSNPAASAEPEFAHFLGERISTRVPFTSLKDNGARWRGCPPPEHQVLAPPPGDDFLDAHPEIVEPRGRPDSTQHILRCNLKTFGLKAVRTKPRYQTPLVAHRHRDKRLRTGWLMSREIVRDRLRRCETL